MQDLYRARRKGGMNLILTSGQTHISIIEELCELWNASKPEKTHGQKRSFYYKEHRFLILYD